VENGRRLLAGWHRWRMRLPPTSPVLARPGSEGISLQIGIARPVVLSGLGVRERAFVASLEGGRPVSPAEARRFARVVSLLTDGAAWARESRPQLAADVAVHGAGALGMEIAAALGQIGLDVALRDEAAVGVEPEGTYLTTGSRTCAGAAAAVLATRGVSVRVGGGGEQLGVGVGFGVPDPLQTAAWMRDDIPHVLVICDEETVWISHVVVPGSMACARCRDLHLTGADSAWPLIALQLGGACLASRRPVASSLARIVVAARIAHLVSRWIDDGDAGVAERIGKDGSVATEPFAAHRACGCGAYGPAGNEIAARRAAWPAEAP
jgi:hypothetical protein